VDLAVALIHTFCVSWCLHDRLDLGMQMLHAQQQQRQRFKALDHFKANKNAVLVATDVAARGLDIPEVRCVVQYQLPPTADTYIHRAGRTARAESDGINIAFVVPAEAVRYQQLHVVLGREPPPAFPVDWALLPSIQARVSLAERIDDLERTQHKASADLNWMAKQARDAGGAFSFVPSAFLLLLVITLTTLGTCWWHTKETRSPHKV
jgi:ATP-dependent RNA helicase DDX24/MAK5